MFISACRGDEFQCREGTCISLDKKCDGEIDCKGGEDEAAEYCSEYHLRN